MAVFGRFTEGARQVIVLAQDEARALKHNYIGTEHLLLGLSREENGIAAGVLRSFDLNVEEIRAEVARVVGQGDRVETGQMPFTPRAKRILELSLEQAVELGHDHIGTEHLLLGLLHEGGGVALRILEDLGAPPDAVWAAAFAALGVDERPERNPIGTPPSREMLERVKPKPVDAPFRPPPAPWLYDLWPALIAGAGIFAGGLFAGWLIWG